MSQAVGSQLILQQLALGVPAGRAFTRCTAIMLTISSLEAHIPDGRTVRAYLLPGIPQPDKLTVGSFARLLLRIAF
jgi:hypothetical protein